jgi:hypothetical protein
MQYKFEVGPIEGDTEEEVLEELKKRIVDMNEEIDREDSGDDTFDPSTHGSFYRVD